MGSISIRGVDDQLSVMLKREAAAIHKSVNQLVLGILKKHTGLDKKKRFNVEHHDLDQLFGRWTKDDFEKIQGKIDNERCIDKELWQ